ncbi:MAG: relaxase/mobilization nuclease domain-containing protein [Phycisphaerales bacterium JB060]
MVPKLHKKGKSFRGAAAYLLHDKGQASSSERVVWTGTRNLATQDPEAAWRVMAATAMAQARLKQQAGIKNTGRRSHESVLHLTLSWHPDEAEGLSREEMMRAALGALRALKAEDRQVLFVAHDDEPQPHLHLLINRVSPLDGRMLSSSKEKLNLSRWAQAYERERGGILCEQRVINNAARKRGEYTRGAPDVPRHIFELQAANDNTPDTQKIRARQKKLDLDLARKTRDLRESHATQLEGLAERYGATRAKLRSEAKREAFRARDKVRAEYRPAWERRFRERRRELERFHEREGHLLGRLGNALRVVDFAAVVSGSERRSALREAYNALSSSGGRLRAFERAQATNDRELERAQKAAEASAIKKARAKVKRAMVELRDRFVSERSSVVLKHDMERAANRAAWRTRRRQRMAAFGHNHTKAPEPDGEWRNAPSPNEPGDDVQALARKLKEERERRNRERDRDRGR